MKIKRDNDNIKIQLIDDNDAILLELGYLHDEFTCVFNTAEPVVISEADDEYLYRNLQSLMDSEYEFSIYSTKTENEITWISDQCCYDLEDDYEASKISRLIIRREERGFVLSWHNPFFEKNGIKRSYAVIGFSPAGNGAYSRNKVTDCSFQHDFVMVFQNTLNKSGHDKEIKLVNKIKEV